MTYICSFSSHTPEGGEKWREIERASFAALPKNLDRLLKPTQAGEACGKQEARRLEDSTNNLAGSAIDGSSRTLTRYHARCAGTVEARCSWTLPFLSTIRALDFVVDCRVRECSTFVGWVGDPPALGPFFCRVCF